MMSEPGQVPKQDDPVMMSHKARQRWENVGSALFLAIIGVHAFAGLYSKEMAELVNSLHPAVDALLWVLAAFLAGFLARGHMDKRLVQ